MTNIETAIKAAIDGGYESAICDEALAMIKDIGFCTAHDIASQLLNPQFWEAIGKSLGLQDIHYSQCPAVDYYEFAEPGECDCAAKYEWQNLARRFFEHVLDGDTLEDAMGKILNV